MPADYPEIITPPDPDICQQYLPRPVLPICLRFHGGYGIDDGKFRVAPYFLENKRHGLTSFAVQGLVDPPGLVRQLTLREGTYQDEVFIKECIK